MKRYGRSRMDPGVLAFALSALHTGALPLSPAEPHRKPVIRFDGRKREPGKSLPSKSKIGKQYHGKKKAGVKPLRRKKVRR